jgi:4-hydroxybutyrate CoA-transferase
MPRTYGQTNFHVSRFTAFVENPNPIIAVPTPPASEVEIKMAENVVGVLKDRDCIQVGIGAVPAMISKLLENSGLKDLGIHTEMMPIGTNKLVEKGVVTCKYKKVNPGKILLAFAMGDKELYDFIANNPMCEFRPTSYANYIPVIAQEDNVVAINGSIEVDLTGQIVSESIGNIIRTGTGGQLDFVIGAFWSKGGRAINLIPSTTNNDTVSRIVPYIAQGARVTVPRHYTGFVVTEYGVADLYGRSEPERAVELIKIAHPKFREELEKVGRERGLIKKKIF